MDVDSFVKQLTDAQKAQLTHGKGAWHTCSVEGLPSVMMTDGPHGLRKQADVNDGINDSKRATCFPTASALACSWSRQSVAAAADAIATEAIAEDVSVVLGPGVNIKRSPLGGRSFEYFSEDPLLAGELATSFVSSMQARGVGSCIKHFAVNSQETGRMTVNAVVDERALREIYLAAFERVVKKAQPYCVMAAYNKVNGESCTQNKKLLSVLRNEWGFDGLVMSDWGASYDNAAAYCAGMDLEMPDGGRYHEQITLSAMQNDEVKDAIDRACTNVVRLVEKCRLPKQKNQVDYAKHHKLCRMLAADSAVLLKNNGILPLRRDRHVLVVGELAEKPRFQGAGSSHVNASCKSFVEVLAENGVKYTYAKGYSINDKHANEQLEFEAARLALKCDTVLFFGGLTDELECESYDRTDLQLPANQLSVLNVVTQHNPNVVFVACGGAPFDMSWIGSVKALLNMYLGGEAVSEAAFDLLFGEVSPSGRLAETIPLQLSDTPCYNYFAKDSYLAEYRESVFVGYRYYNTYEVPVQFPFGYGLSYSMFGYSDLKINKTDDGWAVTVTVKNLGAIAASEVVQVYADNPDCGYLRPKRQLVGFEKVFIGSGCAVDVTVNVENRAFELYLDGAFRTVPGRYKISVCKDVEHVVCSGYIEVEGLPLKGNDRKSYPTYYERRTYIKGLPKDAPRIPWEINEDQFYTLVGSTRQQYIAPKRGEFTLLSTLEQMAPYSGFIRRVLGFIKRYAVKHSPTKSSDDPVAKMTYVCAITTPLISMMSVGGVKSKYVLFLLHCANKHTFKALSALCGK